MWRLLVIVGSLLPVQCVAIDVARMRPDCPAGRAPARRALAPVATMTAAPPEPAVIAAVPETVVRDVIMKFGGSSVRDAERIREVCSLVSERIDVLGLRPHLVCSAMGKTTNHLLAACDTALEEGTVELTSVRALHEETIASLGVEGTAASAEIRLLLDECENTLSGVAMLGELSPRSRDKIVSYGERMSGRMVAACLASQGLTSQFYESWELGVVTTSDFGDASVLDSAWPHIGAS